MMQVTNSGDSFGWLRQKKWKGRSQPVQLIDLRLEFVELLNQATLALAIHTELQIRHMNTMLCKLSVDPIQVAQKLCVSCPGIHDLAERRFGTARSQ